MWYLKEFVTIWMGLVSSWGSRRKRGLELEWGVHRSDREDESWWLAIMSCWV